MFKLQLHSTHQYTQKIIHTYKNYNAFYHQSLYITSLVSILTTTIAALTTIWHYSASKQEQQFSNHQIYNFMFIVVVLCILLFMHYGFINNIQHHKYDNYYQILAEGSDLYEQWISDHNDITVNSMQINQIKQNPSKHDNIYYYNNIYYIDVSNIDNITDLWNPINTSYELYTEGLSAVERSQTNINIFMKEKLKFFKSPIST